MVCVIDKSPNPLGEISAWQMVVMHLEQVRHIKNQEGDTGNTKANTQEPV